MLYRTAPGPALARLSRPRARRPTSLAVIADPHVTPQARGTWKVYHRTEERLARALRDADRLGVDAVVLLGDLTKDGRPAAFDRVDELLAALDRPWIAVPGNHDVPKASDDHWTPPVERFATAYAGGRLPFVERVGGIELIGLDSATCPDGSLAETHAGRVAAGQLDWLESILPGLSNPVVVSHHNLTRVADRQGPTAGADRCQVENARELGSILAGAGVELVLSGHAHWPATATLGGVREVVAPATCSLPQAFLHVEIDSTGTTVELVPLADRAEFEEAYAHARADRPDGRTVANLLDRGSLGRFPLVDEQPDATDPTRRDLAPSSN